MTFSGAQIDGLAFATAGSDEGDCGVGVGYCEFGGAGFERGQGAVGEDYDCDGVSSWEWSEGYGVGVVRGGVVAPLECFCSVFAVLGGGR